MDQFENQLRQFYNEKKEEDNNLIPGFETFHVDKLSKPRKRTVLIFRIAASIAAIAAVAFVFVFPYGDNSKPADKITRIEPISLPTHSLDDKSLTVTYIWQWKAPTDKLLEDAMKTKRQEAKGKRQ